MIRVATIFLLLCLKLESAQPAPGLILTISAPPGVMLQDSTNLIDWQNILVTTNLMVLVSSSPAFYRGELQPTFLLFWDMSPNAIGYKIYYGPASHTYRNSILVGNTTMEAVTVSPAYPYVYFAVTAVDGTNESDFSNEIKLATVPPVLTITR